MEYDPLNTMIALNMAVISVNRIITSHDRAVLTWEYENIINRLALGNIASDEAMTAIYDELMDFITGRGLRDEEISRLRETYEIQEQESWYRIMADGTRGSGGLWNFVGNMCRKLERKIFSRGIMMSWYGNDNKYEAEKLRLSRESESALWRLKKEDVEACNNLCKKLLISSWKLLDKYKLGDEYRLTSESLIQFSRAVDESNPSNRLIMLRHIEHLFRAYPPYWFICAVTADESGNESECRRYMDKFDEIWRPVLRYDPYRLEAAKYRIRELAGSGKPSADREEEIRRLAGVVKEYASPGDWSSNLVAGMVYFALGDRQQGINIVKANTLFGYEKDISGAVLSQLEGGRFEAAKLTSGLHWLVETDTNELSIDELKKLAESGRAYAQFKLGCIYYFGERGFSVNYDKAFYWFKESAERGHALGQCNLGVMYGTGQGVPQDHTQAVYWYRKSAEQGNAQGQNSLGVMYDKGQGVPQDYAQAVYWYRKSAEQGNALGQCNLGYMYEFGKGVPQDYTQAVYWYRKSAEQGNAQGQCNLGLKYEYGQGVPKDYTQAVYWYRKSAEQGNAQGQFNLGDMYEFGKGVSKDISQALYWYRKSAEQGNENAKKALERLKA